LSQSVQTADYEFPKKNDSQKNNDRRKIDSAKNYRDSLPDLVKYRFGQIMDKPNNRVVGIRAYPGQNSARDHNPHVDNQGIVDNYCKRGQKIAKNEHLDANLLLFYGIFFLYPPSNPEGRPKINYILMDKSRYFRPVVRLFPNERS
jgi:hypothetical protein